MTKFRMPRGVRRGAYALAVTLAACERVVEVNLPSGERSLVVEARLERVQGRPDGRQRVRLTATDRYFSNAAPPPARGAVVRVVDDAGAVVSFAESPDSAGVYTAAGLVPTVGRRYTLVVDWEHERYEASDVVAPVAPIDSLYFAERKGTLGPRDGLRATIDVRDPPGVRSYYLWDQLVDGARLVVPDSTFHGRVVGADDLVDGQRVAGLQPYGGVVVRRGQVVTVRQAGLSETAYRYYVALNDQTTNDGSPFATAPASVRGNVANRTRPAHRALGYFAASEVAERTAVVR
jgi:hypothetical protein